MIYSLNCNSLNNKSGEIKDLLYDKQPDVVCFCETWLNDKHVPKFRSYNAEWKHRGGPGGGLGILLHHSVQYRTLNVPCFPGGVLEAQILEVHMNSSTPLRILNIYNPNKNVLLEEFEYYLDKLGQRYLIFGDFNAHSILLDSTVRTSNPTGRSIETLLLNNSVSLINPRNMGTYVDRRTGKFSCLDLCLSSPDLSPHTNIEAFMDVGSDHILLKTTVSLSPNKYIWKSIPRYRITG